MAVTAVCKQKLDFGEHPSPQHPGLFWPLQVNRALVFKVGNEMIEEKIEKKERKKRTSYKIVTKMSSPEQGIESIIS